MQGIIYYSLRSNLMRIFQKSLWENLGHLIDIWWFSKGMICLLIEKLQFNRVSFWIQIHNLPYSLLSSEVASSLCETSGEVTVPKDHTEMRCGNFLRVGVAIDVLEPLCRGRQVKFDENVEGWVSFMYERFPNLCYWCGHLTHDDKDCSLWLRSCGTLSLSNQ